LKVLLGSIGVIILMVFIKVQYFESKPTSSENLVVKYCSEEKYLLTADMSVQSINIKDGKITQKNDWEVLDEQEYVCLKRAEDLDSKFKPRGIMARVKGDVMNPNSSLPDNTSWSILNHSISSIPFEEPYRRE
jgi:hypothetical protein